MLAEKRARCRARPASARAHRRSVRRRDRSEGRSRPPTGSLLLPFGRPAGDLGVLLAEPALDRRRILLEGAAQELLGREPPAAQVAADGHEREPDREAALDQVPDRLPRPQKEGQPELMIGVALSDRLRDLCLLRGQKGLLLTRPASAPAASEPWLALLPVAPEPPVDALPADPEQAGSRALGEALDRHRPHRPVPQRLLCRRRESPRVGLLRALTLPPLSDVCVSDQ